MSLLRIDDGNVVAAVNTVQHRAFCHFATTTERAQQMPTPELGCVSVIGISFQVWDGAAWVPFPPALTTHKENQPMTHIDIDTTDPIVPPVEPVEDDDDAEPDDSGDGDDET